MIMKHRYLLVIIPLLMKSFPLVQADDDPILIYQKFDHASSSWTNITIEASTFSVASGDAFLDGLTSDFLISPWYDINKAADDSDFYNLNLDMLGYTLAISISSERKSNTIRLDTTLVDPTPEVSLFIGQMAAIFNKITGNGLETQVWPLDLSVDVMESYPPQYGVSVLFIRGNDLLTVVEEYNVTLVVGEVDTVGDLNSLDWITNASYVQNQKLQLNSGGNSQRVGFDTFTLGTIEDNLNYSRIGVAIFMDEELLVHSHLQGDWKVVIPDQSDLDNIPDVISDTSSADNLSLLAVPVLLATLPIILIKKKLIRR